jgi:glycosyltransferase involved in cell wall biosynthesis
VINYISNLPRDLRSGGFSSMNVATLQALTPHLDTKYVGPVSPPIYMGQKVRSKVRRLAGLPGDFYFFSDRRLRDIADQVEAQCSPAATLDFFHGFTPWILTAPGRPYIASSDCTFHEYINIFHRRRLFTDADVTRIEEAEGAWLKKARGVILRSQWAADRAIERYGLAPARVRFVRSCGEVQMPEHDTYAGAPAFVFVSTNFQRKGGAVAVSAFRRVRAQYPAATLTVIGDQPSARVVEPGLTWTGYLKKEVPAEAERLRRILAQARALVHPTRSDVSPLILAEAGHFGCPAISSRMFAIPEIVADKQTGLLLDDPTDVDAVSSAMRWMLESGHEYQAMRRAVWAKTRSEYSKEQFDASILAHVTELG